MSSAHLYLCSSALLDTFRYRYTGQNSCFFFHFSFLWKIITLLLLHGCEYADIQYLEDDKSHLRLVSGAPCSRYSPRHRFNVVMHVTDVLRNWVQSPWPALFSRQACLGCCSTAGFLPRSSTVTCSYSKVIFWYSICAWPRSAEIFLDSLLRGHRLLQKGKHLCHAIYETILSTVPTVF